MSRKQGPHHHFVRFNLLWFGSYEHAAGRNSRVSWFFPHPHPFCSASSVPLSRREKGVYRPRPPGYPGAARSTRLEGRAQRGVTEDFRELWPTAMLEEPFAMGMRPPAIAASHRLNDPCTTTLAAEVAA